MICVAFLLPQPRQWRLNKNYHAHFQKTTSEMGSDRKTLFPLPRSKLILAGIGLVLLIVWAAIVTLGMAAVLDEAEKDATPALRFLYRTSFFVAIGLIMALFRFTRAFQYTLGEIVVGVTEV